MTTNNDLNLNAQGIAYLSSGAFSGVDGSTANFVLQSKGTNLAPSSVKPNMFLTTSGTFTAVKSRGYILTGASTITLPTSPVTGDTIHFALDTSSTVVITASSGQVISIQNVISNYAGTATCSTQGASLVLVYNGGDTSWIAYKTIGTWTLNTFLVSSVGNGLMWLDGADPLGTGTPPTDGSNTLPVDKLAMKTLAQATSSKRPVYLSNTLNGRGVLAANAANNTFVAVSGGNTYSANTSIFMVMQPSTASSAYSFGGTGGNNSPSFISNFGGLSYEFYHVFDRYTFSAGATGFNLLELYQVDATSVVGYLNGVQVFSAVPTVVFNATQINALFCAADTLNNFTGDIAEFFLFRTVVSDSIKLNLRRYIAQKWGLAIAS